MALKTTLNVQGMFPDLNLEPDSRKIGLLVAYQYRRGRARNRAVNHAVGGRYDPAYLSGPNRALLNFYDYLLTVEQAEALGAQLYEALQEKILRAEAIGKDLTEDRTLDTEQKADLYVELEEIERDIKRITELMERLGND